MRIACNPILDDLLIMETDAEGKSGQKGERSEGRVGDGDPTRRKRDDGQLSNHVVWHGGECSRSSQPRHPIFSSIVGFDTVICIEYPAVVGTRYSVCCSEERQ